MIERMCMSDTIRDTLMERILDGVLAPGERLKELVIAEEFETSQTPVREALRELEALRLVVSEPYRGTRVRAISSQEMAEAYEVRAVLEQRAAELAAPYFHQNTGELRQLTKQFSAAAKSGDVQEYARLNVAFHRCIVVHSDNGILLQTWESLGFEMRMRVNLTRQPVEMIASANEHIPIIDALEAGDGTLAGRRIREHVESFVAAWKEKED